jgi:hypothetical protein
VLGVTLAFGRLEDIVALASYYLVFGVVLFASGTCVLREHLHQNPAAWDDFNERENYPRSFIDPHRDS